MSIYAKLHKAYKDYRLFSGMKKQLAHHDGVLFLHDTHFSRAIPSNPGLLVYDCVDLPLMHQRTSKARRSRHKYYRAFIDFHAKKAASKADIITLTSPFYKSFLSYWLGEKVNPILLRNFSQGAYDTLQPDVDIKEFLKLNANVTHWIVIHNRIGAFLDLNGVLKALDKLPKHWGVCFLGVYDESNSKTDIQSRANQFCPNHVVLCHDALYGEAKLAALKCFDLGLVPLIAESQNLKRCIPNRSLELLGVGIPQVAYKTRALKNLNKEFPDRIFVPQKATQGHFEKTLKEVCKAIELKKNPYITKSIPMWKNDFDVFADMLNTKIEKKQLAKNVVILSENNPKQNNRLDNLQNSLKQQGYSVRIFEIDTQNHEVILHD